MPGAAALPDDAELWRPWADLPLDLLRDISRRLHATTDYVQFHATCKPWRDTLPAASCHPAFLPWLLSPPDSTTKHRKARRVFPYCVCKSTHGRGTGGAATQIRFRDQRWVISLVDGTAVFTLTTSTCSGSGRGGGGLSVDHLTGAVASESLTPLPPLSSSNNETKWWMDNADSVVFSDGTILLYTIGPVYRPYYVRPSNAAILRPGDAALRMLHSQLFSLDNCSCIAHYDGKVIVLSRYWSLFCIETRHEQLEYYRQWDAQSPTEYCKALEASYLLESRGKLLLANVLANDCPKDYRYTVASFVDGLSVSVYALQEAPEGGNKQWVKRDGRSLADRVMFLGRPCSFAVDAARFGVISGGCAYFVIKKQLYGGRRSKLALKRCRVFKYSFQDGRSELIEQLPAEWDDDACMWITPPQPSIASTEEIRERLE